MTSGAHQRKEAEIRLKELADLVAKKQLDGTLTSRVMDQVEAERRGINSRLKNLDTARRLSNLPANGQTSGEGWSMDPPDGRVAPTSGGIDDGRRLSFKSLAEPLARKILTDDGFGVKSLAPSGAAVVEQQFVTNPVALGKVATGLLDILPVINFGTSQYAYLRQTTRTNNAAVVTDGSVKPTSVYGVSRIEQALAVIAHLSDGVNRYWFLDNVSLQGFIMNELAYGLNLAVEAKVFSDIAATTGLQTQSYSTSPVQTLRKALTKLETAGWHPAAMVLHPSDWETVELALATTAAVEFRGLPYDAAARRLFAVPVALTISQTPGTAHVLGEDAVALATDNYGIQMQWSETSNSDDFSKNLVRARCEGRFGTAVYRPGGVVVTSLTSGSGS